MRALLLSTYELGHQPLHLAGPAAALTRAGHEVRCVDLAVSSLEEQDLSWADAVAVSVPMHTAMRLARALCRELRAARPDLAVCFYGLYAGVDDGADPDGAPDHAITGEYEGALVEWFAAVASGEGPRRDLFVRVELGRRRGALPSRPGLPPLERYARLVQGAETRLAGYVEASHGCAHRCRHCPVPVVYDGRTRVVGVEDVLADVAQLVGLGARHVTFGDPDFLNGPHHARRVVTAVYDAFPELTFDVTA
ncbi:MAG: cobalamin-dependent protein, partial [Acidimicrobiales bacterium]